MKTFRTNITGLLAGGLTISMLLLLSACGGGGNSSNSSGNSQTTASYAYITDGTSMKIVDITDFTAPVAKGTIPMLSAYKASVSDGYVYVAESGPTGYYVNVIDVSDEDSPTNMLQVSKDATFGKASDLYVDGTTIYIADEFRGLHIIDAANGTFTPSSNYANTGHASDAPSVTKLGNFLYLIHQNVNASGQFGVEKFNLSTPGQVGTTGVYNTTDVDSSTFNNYTSILEHDGADIFVANFGDMMFRKFDPTTLAKLSEVDIGGYPTALAIADGYAYITMHPSTNPPFNSGLDAIVMVYLSAMTVVDTKLLNMASGVAVYDDKAYVTDSTGLHIYDVSAGSLVLESDLAAGAGNFITLGE